MSALPRLAALALPLTLLAGPAAAESPRQMMVELHVGNYTPEVDAQFEGATPWQDVFGSKQLLLFQLNADYQIWQAHGSLAIGMGAGYGFVDGKALNADGSASKDSVGFNLMPLSASLIYRWDWLSRNAPIPFVPYGKIGLTAAIWWATDGKNEIANTNDAEGDPHVGRGLTFGWHAGVGLQFLLDILSPGMAREFDNESGVNNSYIFAELLYTQLNDFGSNSSIDLSDTALSFGLMFEF